VTFTGGVSEWSKVPDSKSGVPAMVPGVRIPFSPPSFAPVHDRRYSCRSAASQRSQRLFDGALLLELPAGADVTVTLAIVAANG
jgi:hypothetical protein